MFFQHGATRNIYVCVVLPIGSDKNRTQYSILIDPSRTILYDLDQVDFFSVCTHRVKHNITNIML